MDPVGLATLLQGLPQVDDANLLVGFDTSDDAGVYKLRDDLALIATADFITPPVEDPYLYGQIAAANALSDVYAMGGEPKVCLNLVCFPSARLEQRVLENIVAGALSKITEAGAVLAGGHSVEDSEPKFGLSVIGLAHPDRIWTNGGLEAGDVLVLTKPLGSGVLFNANLKKWVSPAALQACVDALVTLNRGAAEAMRSFSIHAATDVTGFGLGGHLLEMARPRGAELHLDMDALPIFAEALAMYEKGMNTGVNRNNEKLIGDHLSVAGDYPAHQRQIIFDPQTSGGLLVAVPADEAAELTGALRAIPTPAAAVIGRVVSIGTTPRLVFT